jgi:hypothetical protein
LNVVFGYPKSIAASKLVRHKWETIILPHVPELALEEIDAVQLSPFVPGKRNAKQKKSAIDFLVRDKSLASAPVLFYIELKTGPSSLLDQAGMREFQLDVNDYVDIITVMRDEGKPAYVFHAQVTEEYSLPTRRSVGREVWWTDIFSLRSSLKEVRQRRGEDKDAGYYDPKVFRPIEEFPAELSSRGYLRLSQKLKQEGIRDLPTE